MQKAKRKRSNRRSKKHCISTYGNQPVGINNNNKPVAGFPTSSWPRTKTLSFMPEARQTQRTSNRSSRVFGSEPYSTEDDSLAETITTPTSATFCWSASGTRDQQMLDVPNSNIFSKKPRWPAASQGGCASWPTGWRAPNLWCAEVDRYLWETIWPKFLKMPIKTSKLHQKRIKMTSKQL